MKFLVLKFVKNNGVALLNLQMKYDPNFLSTSKLPYIILSAIVVDSLLWAIIESIQQHR